MGGGVFCRKCIGVGWSEETDSVSKMSLRSEGKTCPCMRWTLPIPKLYGRGSYTFLFATGRGGG